MTCSNELRFISFVALLASVGVAACSGESQHVGIDPDASNSTAASTTGDGASIGTTGGGALTTGTTSGATAATGTTGSTTLGFTATDGGNMASTTSGLTTTGTTTTSGAGTTGGFGGSTSSTDGAVTGAGGTSMSATGTTGTDAGVSTTGAPAGGYPENTGAGCDVSAGEMSQNDNLPDPFMMNDGSRISSMAEWPCRRNEILKDIERYEIGSKPEPPTVQASVNGGTLEVEVTTDAGSLTLNSSVGGGSGCVMISMGLGGLSSGCVGITFSHDQVVSYDNGSGSHNQSDPYYTVYPDQWGQIGKYSAWAWGVSRLIDGLEQVQDELGVDITKIGVQGCSYAGKMALFSGAFDERIALTIAQESGGGGINSWRTSQNFTSRTGTNIEKIDNTNGSWFLQSMKALDPYSLPHDHHELIAMIAPRAIIALGNRDYEWLGDESGYKSMNAAREVWKAMGIEDHIGYDFTDGHSHCVAPQSQQDSVAAFVDRFLEGGNADTNVLIDPPASGFELDYSNVIDWTTPTLQ